MTPLATQHCQRLEGQPAMPLVQIQQHLTQVPGWAHRSGGIEKSFDFKGYAPTLAFVNAVAALAEREDHHPQISFGYNRT